MILTRTVFVLGAGASHPYHMPLGLDLFAGARSIDPNHEVFQTYVQGPHETDRANAFNAFLGAVRKHPGPSLDAFLEDQPQHRDVGHVVIAGLMGQSIRLTAARPTPIDPSKDWLAYLINEMRSGTRGNWKEFVRDNRVTFVTFNFDNVIEDRLLAAVNDLYAFHRDDLQAVLQRDLPVLHVHGQLPPMPTLNQEWLELAAKSVKVILDELDMTVVEAAKRALSEAEVICFLGFAYSTENLEALDVPSVFGSSSQAIYGSALDLKDGEQIRVKRYFNQRIELAKEAFDSKAVLRQYDVIRPSTTRRQNRSSQ